jgi:triphosphoribosyl-dephospho-CoA synthase
MTVPLSAGACAQLACILEATARKPGNVHRNANFEDCSYLDFLLSAQAIAEPMDEARHHGVGLTVLGAVRATRRVTKSNTNLGMILLFAPLAAAYESQALRDELRDVLDQLTVADARHVYQAVRLAKPGGLGKMSEQDIDDEPTVTLAEAMRLASPRDLIARQYVNGYAEVFERVVPRIQEGIANDWPLETSIIWSQLQLLADVPDTLITRKRGSHTADIARYRAKAVLEAGWPRTVEGKSQLAEFDAWLREDGHARNPGATADLVAAGLFVALRDGTITLPIARFDCD